MRPSRQPGDSPRSLSADRIAALLGPFGVRATVVLLRQIQQYMELLQTWNEVVGLTTVSDPEEIVVRHFGESLFLASLWPVEKGRLADLGSGAGFPGLALKLIAPELHVVLIESNNKKCAFLREVIRTLDLRNAEVLAARFEDIRETKNFADIVTARALGDFREILRWSAKSLSANGLVALWVGAGDSAAISQTSGWMWRPAVRIPESQRRFLLIGSPSKMQR